MGGWVLTRRLRDGDALLAYRLILLARRLVHNQKTAWIVLSLGRLRLGSLLILLLLSSVPEDIRPYCVKGAQKLRKDEKAWEDVIDAALRRWRKRKTLSSLEVLVLLMIGAQRFLQVLELLHEVGPAMLDQSATLRNALTVARIEVGDFRGAVEAAHHSFLRNPKAARNGSDCAYGAFACGQLLDFSRGLEFFAAQYDLIEPAFGPCNPKRDKAIWNKITKAVLREVLPEVVVDIVAQRRIGIFFLNSTQALGHAILDPYHFLALTRGQYERVLFIGPPRKYYSPASATCLQIIEQYGDYIETNDDMLLNLSWQSLGRFSLGSTDFIVSNYWALLREATLRTSDATASFQHNAWHMELPEEFEQLGAQFAGSVGIDLARPIITLHARDVGYHKLVKQSYRDVDISDYTLAIEHMLNKGYQIVRLGDSSMKKLEIDSADYYELPFCKGYKPYLDPFFISKSLFMIGCQSGPCAYARAFGKPLLSLNAVYHYTLLPSPQEMAAFKHYMARDNCTHLRELGIAEILDQNLFWCENLYQFSERKLELHSLSADEILEAVYSMIAWVENPELPMTPAQLRCAELIRDAARRIKDTAELPVANYLGFSLPGYRIAPAQANALIGVPAGTGRLSA